MASQAWAQEMYEETDGWVRRASGEIRVMLSMVPIMVFLTFESELGEYTEATTRWHKSPSEKIRRLANGRTAPIKCEFVMKSTPEFDIEQFHLVPRGRKHP